MTLSIWRYAHLTLAIVSSLFLLILSITGVILAVDAVNEKIPAYRVDNFNSINLAQSLPALRKVYPEITELSVDHNQFVILDATDEQGKNIKAYIDPLNGKILGPIKPKSAFIQWTLALHRSLFLHEAGRIIIGVTSFLLLLISLSGIILIAKRQQGIRHFFAKINRDFFAQYFHVAGGRLLLIPILALAITGTHLFLDRIEIIKQSELKIKHLPTKGETLPKKLSEFPIFQQTKLAEIEKIEFPFMEDDPEEFFVLKLKDRAISVNQLTGAIVEETRYPFTVILEKLSLDIHTGRTNALWAIILGFASLNILAFIYTGFVITFKRTRTKIKNKFNPQNAEIVLLVGSENGSTLFFANQIHQQLLAAGKRSYLTEMNKFGHYPSLQHLLVFTSTYGLGTAPTNATHFEELLHSFPPSQAVQFAVVGFGSKAYPDFCAYAKHIDQLLQQYSWASRYLDMFMVNDKSVDEFVKWVHAWSEKSLIALATAPALYSTKIAGLKKLKVVEKTVVSDTNSTFKIVLKPKSKTAFQSGDLLAIYPANDNRERFYSIAQNNDSIQLIVKLHPQGLGSGYLYELSPNQTLQARIVSNSSFHFPEKATAVAMIANGTGIAPFLGMIMNNHTHTPIHVYAGFRQKNEQTIQYQQFAQDQIAQKHLKTFEIAYSREATPQYVMDLIRRDCQFFTDLLENNGVIMICGSLAMHKDVEIVLDQLCFEKNNKNISHYIAQNQILTDCY